METNAVATFISCMFKDNKAVSMQITPPGVMFCHDVSHGAILRLNANLASDLIVCKCMVQSVWSRM